MAIHLVTGHAGADHITSGDTGRLIAGIVGTGRYVLRTGTQMEATVVSSNLVRIGAGDAVDQGRHICIPAGTYEEAAIDNGYQYNQRIDTIALRYEKGSGGVESASLVVVKGTEVTLSGTPTPPTLTTGSILNGALVDEMALYNVHIMETQIVSVDAVYGVAPSLASTVDLVYPVGSIYMSTADTHPETLFPGTKWYTVSGRFLLGSSGDYAVGTRGGEATHVLTEAEMPSHSHSMPTHDHKVPGHTHGATVSTAPNHAHAVNVMKTGASGTARLVITNEEGIGTKTTQPAGSHTHTVTIQQSEEARTGGTVALPGNTGQGAAHNNMPPYFVVNMWRRYQ